MKNLKQLFDGFENLNGAKFISINGYLSETSGELANHVINTNISVMAAKKKDYETLKSADIKKLNCKSVKTIAIDVYNTALTEMLKSAEKNISENKEDRTAQSQAQTDAYINISNAIKIHKDTGRIHIFGMAVSKTVLVPGEYKKVNSRDKTIAKKEITKELNLRAAKFRTFILENIKEVKMNGDTLVIGC